MSINVMAWVWDHSRSQNAARLVLLAIADCARSDGSHAFPSIAELQRKANLKSNRSVQDAIKSLVDLGELTVEYNAGRGGCNLYRVVMTPAESAGVQNLRGAKSAGGSARKKSQAKPATPAESAPPSNICTPQNSTPTPADIAGGTVRTVSTTEVLRTSESRRRKKPVAEVDPETAARNELAKQVLDWWWTQLPIKPSGKGAYHSSLRVINNLLSVGHEAKDIASAARGIGAPITTARMEIELGRNGRVVGSALAVVNGHAAKPSTTDQRVATGLALADYYRERGE